MLMETKHIKLKALKDYVPVNCFSHCPIHAVFIYFLTSSNEDVSVTYLPEKETD